MVNTHYEPDVMLDTTQEVLTRKNDKKYCNSELTIFRCIQEPLYTSGQWILSMVAAGLCWYIKLSDILFFTSMEI